MFDLAALREYCDRFNYTPRTVKLLERALVGPLRHVRSSMRNSAGSFFDPGSGQLIAIESRTVEARLVLHCRFALRQIAAVLDQGFELPIRYPARNGQSVRTKTTVDYVVLHLESGAQLTECKSDGSIAKLLRDKPGRYVLDETGRLRSPPAEEAASTLGLRYVIFVSSDVSEAQFRNYLYFKDYADNSTPPPKELADAVVGAMREVAYCSKTQLLQLGGGAFDVDDIHWCIAWRLLTIDWDRPFSSRGDSLLFRDANSLAAYNAARILSPGALAEARIFDVGLLRCGDTLSLDGTLLTVTLKTTNRIFLSDPSDSPIDFRLTELEKLYAEGLLGVIRLQGQGVNNSLFAPPEAIDDANARLTALETVERIPSAIRSLGVTARTYRNWRSAKNRALESGEDILRALIPKTALRGWRGSHLSEEQEHHIQEFLNDVLPSVIDRSASSLYGDYAKHEESANRVPVSLPTFRSRHARYVKQPDIEVIQKGTREAYQNQPFYERLYLDTPVHGTHAFSVVHIDHTPLSQVLISYLTGEQLGKAWLSIAMCAFTRSVLAFVLSFRPPSRRTLFALFLDLVRRHGRAPSTLVHDGGKEFGANSFARLKKRYRVDHIERVSKPRGGSVLERMFGTTEGQISAEVAGNTKSRKRGRLNTRLIDASAHAGLTLGDDYEVFEEYFCEIYDNKRHPALHVSPRQARERSLACDGERPSRLVRYDGDFLFEMGLEVERTYRTVNRRTGVNLNGYDYVNLDVQRRPTVAGHRCRVREHLFDPGIAFVECDHHWQEFRSSALLTQFSDADPKLQRVGAEELYMLRQLEALSADEAARKVSHLVARANELAARRRGDLRQPEDGPYLSALTIDSAKQARPKSLAQMFESAWKERNPDKNKILGDDD